MPALIRARRLLLPGVALALLLGMVPSAWTCEKHLQGHQQSSDTNQEAVRR